MNNKKEYPLILLTSIDSLFKSIRNIVKHNNDIIQIIHDKDLIIDVKDYDKQSNFKFTISKPTIANGKVLFTAKYNPANNTNPKENTVETVGDSIIKIFERWISYIRVYNNIRIHPDDEIFSHYEQEFYEKFQILDTDADTRPFDIEKQLMVHIILVESIKVLQKDEVNNKELIEEAEDILDNIQNFTKNRGVKRLGVFYAKVRRKGIELFKDVILAVKKELIKKGVNGVIEFINEHFVNLLN